MSILISSEQTGRTQKISESRFGLEDHLQEYVKNNPEIIPLDEIHEDSKLLILAREFSTNSGPIDALGVDQDGNIYVVETKLYKNPDKRTVLAQALDYGASLWKHSGDSSNFIDLLDKKVQKQFGLSLSERLQECFETDDISPIILKISKNIQSGNIKYVILMDTVDDRLKDLIIYVNQNSRFDIYAVDLKYYKHENMEIVIPNLYGTEIKKTVSVNDESQRFDNTKILDWLKEWDIRSYNVDLSNSTQSYLRFTTEFMDSLIPHRSDNSSSWGNKNGNAYYYEIRTDRTGWVQVALEFNSTGTTQQQQAGQQKIMNFVNKWPKKDDWVWFSPISWRVDYQSGEDLIKQDIKKILSDDIPEFEGRLNG